MNPIFNHQKLKVYQKALACCAELETLSESWDSVHAIADHLPRAAEGVVLCIAEASAVHTGAKTPLLDASLGSVLECSACLDIAAVKGLIAAVDQARLKVPLLEVFRMLVGLRRAWLPGGVRDGNSMDGVESSASTDKLFQHERLDVYRGALDVMRWFHEDAVSSMVPKSRMRGLDTLITSMILNIAEGNGRWSDADHARFIETAHRAAIKVVAHLDLCETRRELRAEQTERGRQLLFRVASMTAAWYGTIRE